MTAIRRHFSTLLPASLIVAAFATILWQSAEARQAASEALGLVFTFFSTPFILETSLCVVGLMLVLAINQRRLDKDQDEWVEMEVPAKPAVAAEDKQSLD